MTTRLELDARAGLGRYWTADPAEACRLLEACYLLWGSQHLARVEHSSRGGGGWWVLVQGMSEVRLVALADLRRGAEAWEITEAMLDAQQATIERQQAVAFDDWLARREDDDWLAGREDDDWLAGRERDE